MKQKAVYELRETSEMTLWCSIEGIFIVRVITPFMGGLRGRLKLQLLLPSFTSLFLENVFKIIGKQYTVKLGYIVQSF